MGVERKVIKKATSVILETEITRNIECKNGVKKLEHLDIFV